jgi:hypothetical protein
MLNALWRSHPRPGSALYQVGTEALEEVYGDDWHRTAKQEIEMVLRASETLVFLDEQARMLIHNIVSAKIPFENVNIETFATRLNKFLHAQIGERNLPDDKAWSNARAFFFKLLDSARTHHFRALAPDLP